MHFSNFLTKSSKDQIQGLRACFTFKMKILPQALKEFLHILADCLLFFEDELKRNQEEHHAL